MKERPILFSAPMVKAILDNRKSQTRRVIKDVIPWATEWFSDASGSGLWMPNGPSTTGKGCAGGHWRPCPYGKPGDRLWVKTEHRRAKSSDGKCVSIWDEFSQLHRFSTGIADIAATREMLGGEWKRMPSMLMPRWASRITLEITKVRVERVQDISEADAATEGISFDERIEVEPNRIPTYRGAFRSLWNSINAKRGFGWDMNPWVWVVEFKRMERANG